MFQDISKHVPNSLEEKQKQAKNNEFIQYRSNIASQK